jgi:NAD(P)H-flavin reductase
VRGERDLYLIERLESLSEAHHTLRLVPVLSEPEGSTRRRTGMVTDAVAEDRLDLDGAKAYIAGPPPMVEAAVELLAGLGMRRRDCHADAFHTEAEKAPARGAQ